MSAELEMSLLAVLNPLQWHHSSALLTAILDRHKNLVNQLGCTGVARIILCTRIAGLRLLSNMMATDRNKDARTCSYLRRQRRQRPCEAQTAAAACAELIARQGLHWMGPCCRA